MILNINTNELSFMNALNGEEPENDTIDQTPTNANSRFSKSTQNKFNSRTANKAENNSIIVENTNLLPISAKEFADLLGISIDKITSIHLQGSRLYGTLTDASDYDLMIVADHSGLRNYKPVEDRSVNRKHKFKEVVTKDGDIIQVHIYNQNEMAAHINDHEITTIEFLFHPDSTKVLERAVYNAKIDKNKLVETVINKSIENWDTAKFIINNNSDVYPGLKRVWHSLRHLIFAEQILKDGTITDFSAANYLYNGIVGKKTEIESKTIDFSFFEENYLPLRLELEARIKSLAAQQ